VWAFLLLLAVLAVPGAAQTSSCRLEGIVRDASGAVIPGASVTILNTRTQLTAETITNEAGIFVFPALPPGDYTVSAEAQGFKIEVHTAVTLNVSATVSETFRLEVGATAETITVEASSQRINTADG
jgi:hypothetical protein